MLTPAERQVFKDLLDKDLEECLELTADFVFDKSSESVGSQAIRYAKLSESLANCAARAEQIRTRG